MGNFNFVSRYETRKKDNRLEVKTLQGKERENLPRYDPTGKLCGAGILREED